MIIFGYRTYVYQLALLTLVCGNCGNPAAHRLLKRVSKFTLFFVPLFPVAVSYRTECSFCGTEQRIAKEQADQLQAQAASGFGIAPQGGYGQPGGGYGQPGGGYGQPGGGQGYPGAQSGPGPQPHGGQQ